MTGYVGPGPLRTFTPVITLYGPAGARVVVVIDDVLDAPATFFGASLLVEVAMYTPSAATTPTNTSTPMTRRRRRHFRARTLARAAGVGAASGAPQWVQKRSAPSSG